MKCAYSETPLEATPPPTTEPPKPAKPEPENQSLAVLVAEDNPINQKVIKKMLTGLGHRVTLSGNGAEAVETFQTGRFDLLFMDIQMPVMDGFAATRAIRAWEVEHGGRIPIIAATANAMKGDEEACLAAGMDAYITKPFKKNQIKSMIEAQVSDTEAKDGDEKPSPGD
nr:response regulator [Acanthopleuribacter pedis]